MSKHLELLYVEVEGTDDNKKRSVLGRLAFVEPTEDPKSQALSVGELMRRTHGDGVAGRFFPQPVNLPSPHEIRKGQIALAVLKRRYLKEGINLHPQDLRSQTGNYVKELNELFPDLNLTRREAYEFLAELIDYLMKETIKSPKETVRHRLSGERPFGYLSEGDPASLSDDNR